MDGILKCDHSNDSYRAVRSCGIVFFFIYILLNELVFWAPLGSEWVRSAINCVLLTVKPRLGNHKGQC